MHILLAALLAVAPAVPPATTGQAPQPSIRQFLGIWTPRSPVPLPDGSLLMIDRIEGVQQVFRVTAGDSGDDSLRPGKVRRVQLTRYADGVSNLSVSPDGHWAVVMHAPGGNENTQLTLFDLTSSAPPTDLLARPDVQASVNVWLRDGSGFLYSANDVSPNDFHLYRWDLARARSVPLLAREGNWSVRDVSTDGARVLVSQFLSASDVRAHELDVRSGRLVDLSIRPDGGTAVNRIVGYLPGEGTVLILSDVQDGRLQLFVRDLKTSKASERVGGLDSLEVETAVMSRDRDVVAVVMNENGYGVFHVYSLPAFAELPAPTTERGVIAGTSFRDRTLVWSLSNARRPGTAFATTYKAGDSPPTTRQLTWTDAKGIDFEAFALPELVRYEAFDGRRIPAFLYLPKEFHKGVPIPFIVLYHGGPEGQSRPGFEPLLQYLLAQGYGLFVPNVRGSTGYGREYQRLDDYRNRWDSVRDGVDAAEWLVRQGYALPGRIATYGASYGGYMSVACVVEDAERVERGERAQRLFGACVDNVGIVNLKTFLEETSGYRRKLREVEYGPLSNPAFLDSISVLKRADKIRVPVFIGHGFNDPRVPVQEAMRLAMALKDKGNHPKLFIAPDEGHGFVKLDNRIYFYERMANFLEETIGRPPPPAPN